jgi:alkylhydroperoxidase family enzyme
VPNVLASYSLRPQRLRNFMTMYNEIMLSPSGLSRLEREMVAVVVSSANRATTASSPTAPRYGNYPATPN